MTGPDKPSDPAAESMAEAQRAADELKVQIARVRARIRDAHETLTEHARRERGAKSSKR
jgi:hypothetical protein